MAGKLQAMAKTLLWTIVKGVALALAGWVVSGVCIGVGVWALQAGNGGSFTASSGPSGAPIAVLQWLCQRPWAILSIAIGLVGLVVHVVLAQKFVAQSAMSWAWKAGESAFLEPLVERCLAMADAARPGWMTGVVKWGVLKANLLVALGKDPQIGVFRKWLFRMIFVKLSIKEELPVGREALGRLLVERIRGFMSEIVEPSATLSAVVMFGQLVFATIAVVVDGR